MQITIEKNDLKELEKYRNRKEFVSIIKDLINDDTVKLMKNFRQHYTSSCYNHCLEVAYWSYLACKKLGLDYVSAARGGMLHDLFLYDWRQSSKKLNLNGLHAFVHPKIALDNASKIFNLNDIEKDIIVKHMWPVTLFHIPKYKESYIITIMDKLSALKSCHDYYESNLKKKSFVKYAYIFFASFVTFC